MTDTLSRPRLTREQRAAAQARRSWRRRLVGWISLVLVLLLGGAAAYVVWWSPVLGVDTVEVASTSGTLTPQMDAETRTAVGVDAGTPLIRVDLEDVALRIEQLQDIADAAVTRHWPGTLRVLVTPRTEVAAVQANSSWYLIDPAGHLFQTVPGKPAGLLELRLATPGPNDPATMAGVAVVQALTPAIVPLIATVSAHSAQNVTLELTDGRTVRWGSAAESARKAQILPAVLTREGSQFDISVPDLVTVR